MANLTDILLPPLEDGRQFSMMGSLTPAVVGVSIAAISMVVEFLTLSSFGASGRKRQVKVKFTERVSKNASLICFYASRLCFFAMHFVNGENVRTSLGLYVKKAT